jgi:hypothetical protein
MSHFSVMGAGVEALNPMAETVIQCAAQLRGAAATKQSRGGAHLLDCFVGFASPQ